MCCKTPIGVPVRAYRAPSFSITRQSLWALEILVEEGFLMDSSVFPIRHDRYGIPGARPEIHRLDTPAGPLWEFPMSVVRLAWMNLPVGGGGYFRLYPMRLDAPPAVCGSTACIAVRSSATSIRGNSIPDNRGCGLALGCPGPGTISIWPLRKRSWTSS